ncbi:MAG: beta-propeller domain-containing protein [Actinomycetia bacterium]|nr:beta-propeller domain-containing protein [Actinomycetes bacterium]
MRRTIIALVAVIAVVGTACTSASTEQTDTTTTTSGTNVRGPTGVKAFAASSLQPFDSCTEFLDYVRAHAIERVGPYGLDGYGGYPVAFEEVAQSLDSSRTDTTTAASGGIKGVDYSGTNVQVAGVDEPDIVKTDGERIFVVAQGSLYWIDASDTPEIVASLRLDGWGQQLFLSGDRLLVMTSGGGYGVEPFAGVAVDSISPGYQTQRVVLTEVDVSSPDSMETVSTLMLDGSILSSRMADGTIRVVVQSGPTGFDWVYPEGSGIRAEQKAVEANKKLIEESTLENWVPWYILKNHRTATTADGPVLGCDQVGHPDEFSGLSMLSILSIDLENGLEPGNSIGLLAAGQTIYASNDNLYVATSPWMAWPAARWEESQNTDDTLTTQLHMFDISDPVTATYVASGEVEGVLHSQWSMDEYEGVLRVVVTDENPWWGSSDVPDTAVVTMERSGDDLVQIGSVDGLGKNERVYAVRFIQEKGYVVTFRQVDPLYVVDLSDPRDPEVKGELKINGYSAYLHPIGENLLLGVGQDATDEGRQLGTQVSVFDVSDPSDPRRLSRLTFEDAYSDAEWDHHAFLWWAPEEISVLPLQRWSWDERSGKGNNFSGAVVVRATPNRVKQLGEIRHPNANESECEGCEVWTAPITRSLVIGDTLFTFSESGVLASDLDTLDDVAWIPFA